MIGKDELAEAMKRYGYKMDFKGRKVKDMRAIGYLWLAYKHGLNRIESKLLHYSHDGKTTRAVCMVTVYFDDRFYSAIADMDDRSVSVRSPDMVVRACETAALKRAIARALFIDREMLQKMEIGGAGEEEAYPPTPTPPTPTPSEDRTEDIELDW